MKATAFNKAVLPLAFGPTKAITELTRSPLGTVADQTPSGTLASNNRETSVRSLKDWKLEKA